MISVVHIARSSVLVNSMYVCHTNGQLVLDVLCFFLLAYALVT
jgi:hypothetical protein